MSRPVIALTGATGFIGRHLATDLPRRGYAVRALLRAPASLPQGVEAAVVGDLLAPRGLEAALAGVDAVIHNAGLAHATSAIPEDVYRRVNTDATLSLARAARAMGVGRFVFLSSIRAQSGPTSDAILTEDLEARPTDPYGRSKLAAERGLAGLLPDWAALRPVLVYGPGVAGNMAGLVRLARLRSPLPFGGLAARRSILAVENLAAAVDVVLRHPEPLAQPFVVADPAPLTVAEMVAALRQGLGRRPGLVAVPPGLIGLALRLVGRSAAFERLAGPLAASPAGLMRLGWRPPVDTRPALAALARSSARGA